MLKQKFTVQVTTLPDCDDITRFDCSSKSKQDMFSYLHKQASYAETKIYCASDDIT
jgi:hypothetical protein